MSNTVRLYIDLAALRANYRFYASLKRENGQRSQIIPMIKADAYGHGIEQIARTLENDLEEELRPDFMGTGSVAEALSLRKKGIRTPLLAFLGCFSPQEMQEACDNSVIPLIHDKLSLEWAMKIRPSDRKDGEHFKIALKFDTGMSRFGFSKEDIPFLVKQLSNASFIEPVLVLSHFAASDNELENKFSAHQASLFREICEKMKESFPRLKTSLANSAGALAFSNLPFDYIRLGFGLYGGNPFEGTRNESLGASLKPVMKGCAPILEIRDLKAGQTVSYNRTFTAEKSMKIAVIGLGYANGYPRALSNKASLVINNKRAHIVGRVCMETLLVDITDIEGVKPFDTAWFLGGKDDETGKAFVKGNENTEENKNGDTERKENERSNSDKENAVSVYELAHAAQMIPYELWCNLGNNSENDKIFNG